MPSKPTSLPRIRTLALGQQVDSRFRGNDGWWRSGRRRADYHSRFRGNDGWWRSGRRRADYHSRFRGNDGGWRSGRRRADYHSRFRGNEGNRRIERAVLPRYSLRDSGRSAALAGLRGNDGRRRPAWLPPFSRKRKADGCAREDAPRANRHLLADLPLPASPEQRRVIGRPRAGVGSGRITRRLHPTQRAPALPPSARSQGA